MVKVEQTPDLDDYTTRVTIRQKFTQEDQKVYVARWREAKGRGKTISESLHQLANDVENK